MIECVIVGSYREGMNISRGIAEISSVKKVCSSPYPYIEYSNGKEIIFVPHYKYREWSLGRTYMIGDTVYHSGCPIRLESDNE